MKKINRLKKAYYMFVFIAFVSISLGICYLDSEAFFPPQMILCFFIGALSAASAHVCRKFSCYYKREYNRQKQDVKIAA